MLEPVKSIAAKWPTETARPIAKPAAALASGLLGSQTPQTVSTRMKPRKNSMPKACTGVTSLFTFTRVMPRPVSWRASGVKAYELLLITYKLVGCWNWSPLRFLILLRHQDIGLRCRAPLWLFWCSLSPACHRWRRGWCGPHWRAPGTKTRV